MQLNKLTTLMIIVLSTIPLVSTCMMLNIEFKFKFQISIIFCSGFATSDVLIMYNSNREKNSENLFSYW